MQNPFNNQVILSQISDNELLICSKKKLLAL